MIRLRTTIPLLFGAVLMGCGLGAGIFAMVWQQPVAINSESNPLAIGQLVDNSASSTDEQLISDQATALDTSAQSITQPEWAVLPENKDNRVLIPKIKVDAPITEGAHADDPLNRGSWRLPMTSTPDKGGNTVLSSHRFLRRPPNPNTFYSLDKLEVGDDIMVTWNGIEYHYRVSNTVIINPDQIEVLYNTAAPRLTLMTCTPLFTSLQRLVILADLVDQRPIVTTTVPVGQ